MTCRVYQGDCLEVLKTLPGESVHCCVTSPPYWGLRDYDVPGQLGLEPTPDEYVSRLVEVFREVRRVLRDDGTLWLNLGDSYCAAPGGRQGKNGAVVDRTAARLGVREGHTDRSKIPGIKSKDLVGIPWRVAFALQADGWWLRSDIIWAKPNPMPESVTDRPTKSHEYLFMLAKSGNSLLWRHRDTREWVYAKPSPDYVWRHKATGKETDEQKIGSGWTRINLWNGFDYYFDQDVVKEDAIHAGKVVMLGEKSLSKGQATGMGVAPSGNATKDSVTVAAGRNIRSVWNVATQPYSEAHFAMFPPKLIEPCIKAGCPKGGVVLDPFGGAGTTGLVADRLGRSALLIELNPEYAEMARKRIREDAPLFADVQ